MAYFYRKKNGSGYSTGKVSFETHILRRLPAGEEHLFKEIMPETRLYNEIELPRHIDMMETDYFVYNYAKKANDSILFKDAISKFSGPVKTNVELFKQLLEKSYTCYVVTFIFYENECIGVLCSYNQLSIIRIDNMYCILPGYNIKLLYYMLHENMYGYKVCNYNGSRVEIYYSKYIDEFKDSSEKPYRTKYINIQVMVKVLSIFGFCYVYKMDSSNAYYISKSLYGKMFNYPEPTKAESYKNFDEIKDKEAGIELIKTQQ